MTSKHRHDFEVMSEAQVGRLQFRQCRECGHQQTRSPYMRDGVMWFDYGNGRVSETDTWK